MAVLGFLFGQQKYNFCLKKPELHLDVPCDKMGIVYYGEECPAVFGEARLPEGLRRKGIMKTKDITRMALLTAIALTIFMVEAQLPGLVPVPGIKLGLSNIVTVWAVFTLGPKKASMILAARVFLGAVFSGQMSTILYSGAGGALAIGVTILSRKILTRKQIWVAGVLGAIAHSVGQMAVAIGVTLTPGLAAYLPVMILIGIFTGAFTGFCAQLLTERLKF